MPNVATETSSDPGRTPLPVLNGGPAQAADRVLSTLNRDGSRRWIRPRLSKGPFLTARRVVAYVLIAIFTVTPYLKVNGRPLVLLDLPAREFTLLGYRFLPTDTLLLALLLVSVIAAILLTTALLGRIWCGWACPQTVYMEFLYRPLERLFLGPPGPRGAPGKRATPLRKAGLYVAYGLASMYLAHTFLAYFVGVENLAQWVRQSPLQHPVPFLVMCFVTGAMMFDFTIFREQTCIVACPYGRLQSVMLDRDSLIISYDKARGEPRGKKAAANVDLGDCVDCQMCVDTCPTGIDIRNGLQLECIGCAQCIDACNHVMDKLGRPRGLIRYSSQARMAGAPRRFFRPRILLYPAVLAIAGGAFLYLLLTKQHLDVTLMRGLGLPFVVMDDGRVDNALRVKLVNRSDEPLQVTIELATPAEGELVYEAPIALARYEQQTVPIHIRLPRTAFTGQQADVRVRIRDDRGYDREQPFRLLGPATAGASAPSVTP
jgi:cytochrome c oxidase accessory protein FixG